MGNRRKFRGADLIRLLGVALIAASCSSSAAPPPAPEARASPPPREASQSSPAVGPERGSPGGASLSPVLPSPEKPAAAVEVKKPRERLKPIARTKPREVRASWVVRGGVFNDASAAQVAQEAKSAGINTLIFQVRGRGDAWYRSDLEPEAMSLQGKTFDPLDAVLEHALHEGLFVHAWINLDIVGDVANPHTDPTHLVKAHPEWLALPSELSGELLRMDPKSPGFVTKLSSWVAAHETAVEGLYADPANAAYRAHVAKVAADIARRYPVDGIHFDYVRYAGKSWGWTRAALDGFKKHLETAEPAKAGGDAAALPKKFPTQWAGYRRACVDRLVQDASAAARAAKKDLLISAAVFADVDEARNQVFQDWPKWLEKGWIDVACPMIYNQHRKIFVAQMQEDLRLKGKGKVWAGIGSWQIEPNETIERVKLARSSGADGVVLFSHNELAKRPEVLRQLKTSAFP